MKSIAERTIEKLLTENRYELLTLGNTNLNEANHLLTCMREQMLVGTIVWYKPVKNQPYLTNLQYTPPPVWRAPFKNTTFVIEDALKDGGTLVATVHDHDSSDHTIHRGGWTDEGLMIRYFVILKSGEILVPGVGNLYDRNGTTQQFTYAHTATSVIGNRVSYELNAVPTASAFRLPVEKKFLDRAQEHVQAMLALSTTSDVQYVSNTKLSKAIRKVQPIRLPTQIVRRIVIHHDPKTVNRANGTATGFQTSKSPHWRKGHWRSLQSGKRIWLDPCAIHGGGELREYSLKP